MKKIIFIVLLLFCIDVCAEEKCYVTFQFDEIKTIELECGNIVSALQIPAKENQTFLGWYYGNEVFDFNTLITSDIVLQAKWGNSDEAKIEVDEPLDNQPQIYQEKEAAKNFYFDMSDVGQKVLLIGVVVFAGLIQLLIIPKIKEVRIKKRIKK